MPEAAHPVNRFPMDLIKLTFDTSSVGSLSFVS
jgi:hypothetical protein